MIGPGSLWSRLLSMITARRCVPSGAVGAGLAPLLEAPGVPEAYAIGCQSSFAVNGSRAAPCPIGAPPPAHAATNANNPIARRNPIAPRPPAQPSVVTSTHASRTHLPTRRGGPKYDTSGTDVAYVGGRDGTSWKLAPRYERVTRSQSTSRSMRSAFTLSLEPVPQSTSSATSSLTSILSLPPPEKIELWPGPPLIVSIPRPVTTFSTSVAMLSCSTVVPSSASPFTDACVA